MNCTCVSHETSILAGERRPPLIVQLARETTSPPPPPAGPPVARTVDVVDRQFGNQVQFIHHSHAPHRIELDRE